MDDIFSMIEQDRIPQNPMVPVDQASQVQHCNGSYDGPVINTISDDSLIVQLLDASRSDISKKLSAEVTTCALNDVELGAYLVFRCVTSKARAIELASNPLLKGKDEATRLRFYSDVFKRQLSSRQDLVKLLKGLVSSNDKTAGFISSFATRFISRK